ncbi:mitotic spindle assembly checkpoint protein MAD1-like [Argiope bruennichi]|uniref:mitotic spindle assembly checkpoint protein MAD1-like n=1 Tax=Argiope bruennichi TaxID=94029 RepID=UPI00249568A2|nr:mitotic spindle assembly checkpoint protein MAD1-like [Argiope bruennichi]
MATPGDNTEVIRMLKDVKNSIWRSVTPMRAAENNFNDYISGLSHTGAGGSHINAPNIAARLNFSGLDDTQIANSSMLRSFQSPESLKRKLMNTEAELQTSKAKVKERESLISVMEPANKKLRMSLENKLEKCRQQNELDSQKIEELQTKLKWAKKQIASAKSQISEIERQKKAELDQQELRFIALQQENSNLKVEIADVKSEKTEAIRKLHMEIGSLELKVSMLTEEVQKSQEYIQSLKKKNSEMAETVALCNSYKEELKEAQAKIKELENKIEANKDAALIIASRQNDLKSLNELQKENRILKEEVAKYKESNVMLYQEKMWSLQEKLSQAERKCVAVAKLQVENEQLKARISQWEELFDDKSSPYKSPSAFSRKLSQYQQNEAVLTNKLSHLTSHCETLEKQIHEKEEIIKSLNCKLEQAQLNSSRMESVVKRFQRKILFLSKEKDNCRKLLDSYLGEATISGVALNAAQISHLEEMNAEYKKALEKCEMEIDTLNEKLKNYAGFKSEESAPEENKLKEENATLISKISDFQKENTSLLSKICNLEKENEELKSKLSKQETDRENSSGSGEKVLHLRFNPLDIANQRHLERFNKLQEENDQLKKRVKVLEEEGLAASDVTMKVQQKLQSEGADSTLESLKEQLAAAERKTRFILENARLKSTEFREAVYQLLGYRIDVPMAETYKLSHVYADSRDDYLLFKINSEGIQLVETEYSKQVADKMQTYLHQHDSFPAFLASLTMDLFNQQTFMLSQ